MTPSDTHTKEPGGMLRLILKHDRCALQRRTLRNGTTTACYFATIHTDASLLLCQITGKILPPLHKSIKVLTHSGLGNPLKSVSQPDG